MGERKIKITNQYVKAGLTIFIVGVALIAAYYTLTHPKMVLGVIERINEILFPFYLGAVMAYLMCPIYNGTTRTVYKATKGKFAHPIMDLKIARAVASAVSVLTIIAVVSGLVWMVLPDLWESIMGLIANLPDTVEKVSAWITLNLNENPELAAFLGDKLDYVYDTGLAWAQNKLIPNVESIVSNVSVGVIDTLGAILDVFVALIICVYVLNSKEIFVAQTKKIILAVFKEERAESIFELGRITNETFGGFINGKIIDSIIIGIICFIAMTLLKLPLVMLISVVVGVTNVIPFFGPFIGAIPSIIILLLIDPIAAIKFAVMVLALQQLDGNIIGPKILGKSTNLASFWVMFAIIVAGGLFGFIGMVLGVPVFAVIYTYIRRAVNGRLAEKELPTDTLVYEDFSKYKLEDFDKEAVFGTGNYNKAENDEA